MWVGGYMLIVFFTMSVGVKTSYGDMVANTDLIQFRMSGIIVCLAAVGLGVFLRYGAQPTPPDPSVSQEVHPNLKWFGLAAFVVLLGYGFVLAKQERDEKQRLREQQSQGWTVVPMDTAPEEEARARDAFGI